MNLYSAMLLKLRHGLLEVSNQPTTKQSAIIINNEIILTTGSILLPYVRPIAGSDCACTKIISALKQHTILNVQNGSGTEEAQFLNSLTYQVTYDNHKLPTNNRKNAHTLNRQPANLIYLFNVAEISQQLQSFLNAPQTSISTENDENKSVLLSSFVVLSMRANSISEHTLKRFLSAMKHYTDYMQPLSILDDVLAMVTPFGMEHLFKSISIGKISNVLGRGSSIFIISNPLAIGCEGGAVFNKNLQLIGIIISTCFEYQMQKVCLTMVANFNYIIKDFMRQMKFAVSPIAMHREPTANFSWERVMVVIHANGKQSSGTFVKIHKRKFILTCAHGIYQNTGKICCRNLNGEFESEVLWYNPEYNKPFDVALLTAPAELPDEFCAKLSEAKPHAGQMIFSAGFPTLLNFNIKGDFKPSIFQGRIIKYGPGAIVSDSCMQMGQSGGPMFDQRGNVLGICVSNIFVDETIFPHVNTAVPVYEIRSTLENYSKTNDVSLLNKLVADDPRAWSPTVMALSKI